MSKNRAVVSFQGPHTEIILGALAPEAGRDIPRASVELKRSPGVATLTIETDDIAAMRAALNSYLRWADVASKVAEEARR